MLASLWAHLYMDFTEEGDVMMEYTMIKRPLVKKVYIDSKYIDFETEQPKIDVYYIVDTRVRLNV
jgi:hypothetical protein